MKTSWVTGLTKEKKEDVTSAFKAGTVLRSRLSEMLEDKMEGEAVARTKREDYDSPNWPYRQADSSGYIRALREVISLLQEK